MAQITVIVPVYNVEPYLKRCLNSIVAQHYRDYDVALIDDGSSDGSGELCDQYAEQYPYIHVIHQQNRGLSAARNRGITWAFENSDSQYLTFIDSDDWIHPQYLELLYMALQNSECGVAVGKFTKTSMDEVSFSVGPSLVTVMQPADLYIRSIANFIVAWGKLYQKKDFLMLRFPEGKIHEDEFTTWKVLLKYDQVAVIDVPIYVYFQRKDSIMNSKWNKKRLVAIDALEEQKEWIDKFSNEKLIQFIRWRMAAVCAAVIRAMEKNNIGKREIKYYRKKLKRYICEASDSLSFEKNYVIYRTAWPTAFRIIYRVYRLGRRIKDVLFAKSM